MDQDICQLINYEELISKVVRAKAKVGLQQSSYVQKTDQICLWGSQLAYTIAHKVQTQGSLKDHHRDDYKASKGPVSTPAQDSEPSDKAKKDKKKKKHYQDKRDSRKPKDSTGPNSEFNAAKVGGKREKNKKNVSEITYFHCNKKRHYSNKCPEPPKN